MLFSITKLLTEYYDRVYDGHSFSELYEFIRTHGESLLKELNIASEYFDTQSFLHVCSQFCKEGTTKTYAPLLNWSEK